MKKLFTLLTMLVLGISGMWADLLPSAVVGTYFFQAETLTKGADGHTISKDANGVTISPNTGYFGNNSQEFKGTIAIKINVPETTTAGVLCELRKSSSVTTSAQGLYMKSDRVLVTSWEGKCRADANITMLRGTNRTLDAGEHTIIYVASESGAYVIVDATNALYFNDSGLKKSNVEYTAIFIPTAYVQYVTEVHFFSDKKNDADKTTIFSECANHMHASQQNGESVTVPSGKMLIIDKDANLSKFSGVSNVAIASGKTLTLDNDGSTISLSGSGIALQESDITTTVTGSLPALTLKATTGTLKYTGSSLDGTTLEGVVLAGTARINTSSTVNIKNLAGNNLDLDDNDNKSYAFVGSGTLNFYGTCDLTKKSDGTDCNSANIGYGSGNNVVFKEGANVTAGIIFNGSSNNASVIVESGATFTLKGSINTHNSTLLISSSNLTNNGTINIDAGSRSGTLDELNGSGTINFVSSANITTPSVPSDMTLTGVGKVILTSAPTTTAPTLSDWTGVVEFPAMTSEGNLKGYFDVWGNENSTIRLNNTTGWLPNATINRNLYVIENANFNLNNGSSNNNTTIKQISGNGTVTLTKWSNGVNHKLIIKTLMDFDSDKLKLVGGNSDDFPIVVENIVCETKPACGEKLFATSNYVTVNNLTVNSQPDNDYQISVLNKGENNEGVYITGIDVTSGFYTIQSKNTSFNNYYLSLNMNTSSETAGIPYNGIQLVNERQLDYGDIWYIKYHGVSSEFSSEGSNTEKVYQLWSLKNGWGLSCMNPVLSSSINPRIYTLVSQSGGDVLIQGVSFEGTTDVEQFGLSSSAGIANHKPLYPESATSIKRADAQSGEGSHWLLTKLTQIPFTFNSNALGYATFNCPVDVQVPDDVDAYVCRRNGTQLTLFKIENITTKDDDDKDVPTIPANTPVLLYNSKYTTNPTVQFKTTTLDEEVEVEGNGFYGTVGAKAYDESYSWYSLQKSGDNMGFFKKSSGTLNGFKAWVRVSDTSARQLTIVFDGESDPTGIVEALGLEDENVEIFDLNGRKLSSYQKGINIVNGKKVMVP